MKEFDLSSKHEEMVAFLLKEQPLRTSMESINDIREKAGLPRSKHMDTNEPYILGYQAKAELLVFEYVQRHLEKTDSHIVFRGSDVYVVWFSKTLQNWKALVSTTLPDDMYYEVTYNGDKKETYIDAYKKFDNVCIVDKGSRPIGETLTDVVVESPPNPENRLDW